MPDEHHPLTVRLKGKTEHGILETLHAHREGWEERKLDTCGWGRNTSCEAF